jgi:SAM-dependent methyltransferase
VPTLKRISNILRYGIGPAARKRKDADKQRSRDSRFASELWQRGEGLAKRQYDTYDDYVSHQSAKLDKIEHRLHETEQEDLIEFRRRFAGCSPLGEARSVVCLGARLGTEVQALHALGYFAVGIDLNPGENNAYVLPGDFHALVFPDGSLDAVYTNALDHVFDLDKVLAEIGRVLHPGGLFVADVLPGYDEGFVPGAYEATHWPTLESFLLRIAESSGFARETLTDLGLHRRDHWFQAVFRKAS